MTDAELAEHIKARVFAEFAKGPGVADHDRAIILARAYDALTTDGPMVAFPQLTPASQPAPAESNDTD